MECMMTSGVSSTSGSLKHDKAINFLIGQVMARTGGKANPHLVRQLLQEKLDLKESDV
jgi:Asp-tRNA(Asn)/Glu-tRNA(Gln) amidotransferase B subunit